MIRVKLPPHLRTLAKVGLELELEVEDPVTMDAVLDALESNYPMLRGTIRDYTTHRRRPFLRYYACKQDLSLTSPGTVLPEPVVSGDEPLLIVGAVAGG